jgi:antitoxin component YwqK of YwqJK toxin-antitoxin module
MRRVLSTLVLALTPFVPPRTAVPVVHIESTATGTIRSRATWTRDGLDGVVERFYPTGALESRTQYWRGDKVGHADSFWPNGSPRVSAFYRAGVLDGGYRTWYASGRAYEVRHYTAGHEAGRQQSWTEDGVLFLNYDVRNGRRYGLINATPCVPAGAEGIQ